MNKEQYKQMVDEISPKPKKLLNALVAFLVGGTIGAIAEGINQLFQRLFNLPQETAVIWTIIFFIFIASLFTALNFFDNLVSKTQAGLIIPITGFAHSITSSALDYKKDGLITGLGSNFFKLAGSVLLYGIIASFFLVLAKVVYLWLV